MMVPRAFKYASSPPKDVLDEKPGRGHVKNSAVTRHSKQQKAPARPAAPTHANTQPVETSSASKPVAVPKPERSHSLQPQTMPTRPRQRESELRRSSMRSQHDPNALPPAVAALLAVTAIPPHRSSRMRRKTSSDNRRMSIDELVSEWKSEESIKGSYSSSLALSTLLEDSDDADDTPVGSRTEGGTLHGRSGSAESVPSLDSDERSVLSFGSPSTPESVKSNRSSSNLKRDRSRSHVIAEDSSFDHPLVPPPLNDDSDEDTDALIFSASSNRSSTQKRNKSSFTSNLTTSLKALRSAALTSISSFGLNNSPPQQSTSSPPFSDEMLWSHPFLFPHFSSEVRPPDIKGTPTLAQRRYLNPAPLTFEEQEAPFQQALHAPFLTQNATALHLSPEHEMQPFARGKRKATAQQQKRAGSPTPDPQSEAGRSVVAAVGMRQREPRENSDFLRVVVLEMNMRRQGKLETGKARIWLPPRQVGGAEVGEGRGGVPRRWEGESAVY